MKHGRGLPRLGALLTTSIALAACGGDDKDVVDLADRLSGQHVTLTGSVGDGPIVGAQLTVVAKSGETLRRAVSDQNAGYNIELRARGRDYPLLIEARDGIDLVTNRAPDFVLRGVGLSSSRRATVNLNPFGTLAVATAKRMRGGLTVENVAAA